MNDSSLPGGGAQNAANDRIAEENRRLLWMHRALLSGEIGFDEYRDQRREIIDRVAGIRPLRPAAARELAPVTSPNIPRLEVPVTPAAASPVRLQDPPDDHPQGRSDIVLGIAVVGVVLVVLAALLAFFW